MRRRNSVYLKMQRKSFRRARRARTFLPWLACCLFIWSLWYWAFHGARQQIGKNTVDWQQFAYSLYATSSPYLCNTVMVMDSLSRLGTKADRLLIYNGDWPMTPSTYEGRLLIRAKERYGAVLQPVKVVRHGQSPTWQDSFTKLLAFNQTQYKRVLSLDADATVLQARSPSATWNLQHSLILL